ncbi:MULTISPECIES: YtxH domain-containing protein [Solibacillus]|uniref:YtxH domain-containing protein n=1 Tax=Solibacillus faecavium TaxID=2762221 RepID=A0ABR8Y137_9BACL|nr:YtxH domain-containing protein [Solibacillus faecavium]MBD8037927.1 YtxH domain-containing protein [Solibacillus faecavium]
MKSKLLPFIAIGAVTGAAISMLDKQTREHTVKTAKNAKDTVVYYAENRDELLALVESKIEQAQTVYGTVNDSIQSIMQNGNDIKELPTTIQSMVSETIDAFSKKDEQAG